MVKFDNIQFNFHLKYFPKNESKIQILIQQPYFFKKEMLTYPILSYQVAWNKGIIKSAHHWCNDLLFLVRILCRVLRVHHTKFVNTITFEEIHLATPNLHEVCILGKSYMSSTVGVIDLLLRSQGSQMCPKMACWHNNF